jgi:hypothetical protein
MVVLGLAAARSSGSMRGDHPSALGRSIGLRRRSGGGSSARGGRRVHELRDGGVPVDAEVLLLVSDAIRRGIACGPIVRRSPASSDRE